MPDIIYVLGHDFDRHSRGSAANLSFMPVGVLHSADQHDHDTGDKMGATALHAIAYQMWGSFLTEKCCCCSCCTSRG